VRCRNTLDSTELLRQYTARRRGSSHGREARTQSRNALEIQKGSAKDAKETKRLQLRPRFTRRAGVSMNVRSGPANSQRSNNGVESESPSLEKDGCGEFLEYAARRFSASRPEVQTVGDQHVKR